MKRMTQRLSNNKGVTLVEIVVACVIFFTAAGGILMSYLNSSKLIEASRNSSAAVSAVKSRIEEISNSPFAEVKNDYNNVTFVVAGLTGIGVSYVDDTIPTLLDVKVVFCWQQNNGIVFGEDKDLSGTLGVGEDLDGNGQISSPVEASTNIFNG